MLELTFYLRSKTSYILWIVQLFSILNYLFSLKVMGAKILVRSINIEFSVFRTSFVGLILILDAFDI